MKIYVFKPILVATVMTITVFSFVCQAALINRGNGLIYDDVLDITWMQDANYISTSGFSTNGSVNKENANNWIDNLVFAGYDDWRLPNQTPLNGGAFNFGFSFNGTTDRGFNQLGTHNELAYMFSTNLSNISSWRPDGNPSNAGVGTFNSSFLDGDTDELFSFENIGITYWSNPENDPIPNASWGLNFQDFANTATGEVQLLTNLAELSVWAVRDGDVAATIDDGGSNIVNASSPSTFAMLFFGVAGALATRKQIS